VATDTYGSAALQSLNRILQYQQARDRSEVQESLQLMQFAQQKRQFDMQSAAKNLELLDNSNKQFKLNTAQKFVQDTGMSNVYMKFKGEGENALTDAVSYLTDTWGAGDQLFEKTNVAMDEATASELVSATWELYEAKNPNALINIGARLSPDKEYSKASQEPLLKSLSLLGYMDLREGGDNTDALTTFQSMNDAIENDKSIMQETEEYVRGDYDIQRDFEFTERAIELLESEAAEGGKVGTALPSDTQVTSPYSPDNQVRQAYDLVKSKQQEIRDNQKNLKLLAENIDQTKVLKSQGLQVPEEWELQYQNYEETKQAIDEKIQLLGEDVVKLTNTSKNLREGVLRSQIKRGKHGPEALPGKMVELVTGGHDSWRKFTIWNDTGIWPTDEELDAWAKASGRTSGDYAAIFTSGDPSLLHPR